MLGYNINAVGIYTQFSDDNIDMKHFKDLRNNEFINNELAWFNHQKDISKDQCGIFGEVKLI